MGTFTCNFWKVNKIYVEHLFIGQSINELMAIRTIHFPDLY
jgi:hypothetical protein